MYIPIIIICILFVVIIIGNIRCIKDLIISTKKSAGELIATILGITIILIVTYLYANIWINNLLGILGAIVLILSLYKSGVTSKGFSYSRSYIGFLAPWGEIKSVHIIKEKDIIISFSGHGHYYLYFKEEDYEELMNVLKENLSPKVFM